MDKVQFLVLTFAVLLSKLCNVLLCIYKIYLSSFSILKIAVLRHIRFSKITRRWGPICITVLNLIKSASRLQRYGDLTVCKMAAVRYLDSLKFKLFNGRSGGETCRGRGRRRNH